MLPPKQPLALGGCFGYINIDRFSDTTGRSTLSTFSAGAPTAAQLSGVTMVGAELFSSNAVGSTSFLNTIVLGSRVQLQLATTVSNAVIATNQLTSSNIRSITDSIFVVPNSSTSVFSASAPLPNISSSIIMCTSSISLSNVSSGNVSLSNCLTNPGVANVVVGNNRSGIIDVAQTTGNTILMSRNSALAFALGSAVTGCLVAINGDLSAIPSQNDQIAVSHRSFRAPNLVTGTAGNSNTLHMVYDTATNLVVPTLSSNVSRVARFRATSGTEGLTTVNISALGIVDASTVTVNANVLRQFVSTDDRALLVVVHSITTTLVTMRVYWSLPSVPGQLTMTRLVPNNITVLVTVAY